MSGRLVERTVQRRRLRRFPQTDEEVCQIAHVRNPSWPATEADEPPADQVERAKGEIEKMELPSHRLRMKGAARGRLWRLLRGLFLGMSLRSP